MLGKTRVVEIMEGIDRALAQFVRCDGMTLPPEAVDRLADAIVAVEYYMETIQAGRTDPWYMLDNAETCLRYPRRNAARPARRGVRRPRRRSRAHRRHRAPMSQTVAAPTEHERTAVLDRQRAAADQPDRRSTACGRRRRPPRLRERRVDREIDPEFLELFIEEAKDEIAKLKQLFPLWDENPQDQDALVNVRRSFHTLKGSGRMVGAQLIGEFAWAVENLLNRVINKTLERTPDIMALLRESVAAVPELVEQLETGPRSARRCRHASSRRRTTTRRACADDRPRAASAARGSAPRSAARVPTCAPSRRPTAVQRASTKKTAAAGAGRDGSGPARNLRQRDRGPSRGHP